MIENKKSEVTNNKIELTNEDKIMYGKPLADKITQGVTERVQNLKSKGIQVKLAILKVGNRPDDEAYQRGAMSRAEKCGIETEVVELDDRVSQEDYIAALERLNKDDKVHGILCFRPLPSHIDEDLVQYKISPEKDVDCFSPINIARLVDGDKRAFSPCTPEAVIEILKFYNIDMVSKNVVVLGRSMVVGKPLSMLLLNENSTVTICHSKTRDIEKIASRADIIVSCMGRARMVGADYVGQGACLVDVGINFDENGKMCGDIDFDSVIDRCSRITPVPKGVGGVTSSILVAHTLRACENLIDTKLK
ncbi:Bifunctional protein FolD [Peptostreptococcus anaerobius]|uniref:Bifunctional protein FolD n=1 Tax=Peptostreptococcus anaerobius TaxID=1261 RepID=A0A379CGX2_9FIRM|nr:bifunctional 5,10-methylenetetrahydrofolate dehydrogenase/5,10-methenyltetrahydrofolate cyclohydrolase [Peptostreptococcus anaerobius]EKX89621.1 tetrahydrofolate dehydrogenase/cyclohydrolase, NAD(P)-binding domain protein [Peptostreptococcus anaerobius VPI 4330 = DSM 2949]SFM64942.1 methylenetetrahydrofolate dehydrogenase (NADP+) / methenyltetrahydrofolate cyclohydrolase [Peptostreptococcus anaerobius]SUB61573.1 Bifunctional protein FolD [Peptostreptococcus anaerobius]